jgi:hypothetical protein
MLGPADKPVGAHNKDTYFTNRMQFTFPLQIKHFILRIHLAQNYSLIGRHGRHVSFNFLTPNVVFCVSGVALRSACVRVPRVPELEHRTNPTTYLQQQSPAVYCSPLNKNISHINIHTNRNWLKYIRVFHLSLFFLQPNIPEDPTPRTFSNFPPLLGHVHITILALYFLNSL